ncbi:CbtA family protein [Streptosporangium saharense]|uniref:Putative cobalt transporter CbtA n=1 Tax=Streptosporangium saharense TaxID=1706840 RepID=A0A7W7VR06_9ACTN|nr:CbtA family protein [Streptosporangium saharense]MBB4919587.1 putative cobalt transporter CbtA [Streptosporangium saharense]
MITKLIVRGMLVGLLAGLLAGVFAYTVGEPRVDRAIALEEAAAASSSHAEEAAEPAHSHEEEELVSRDGQRLGLFLALGLYGVALGGLFALVYAGVRGRVGPRSEPLLAISLAAASFVAIVLVPFVKYPANPPAVGDPETINQRTVLYLVAVVIGILAVGAAAAAYRYVSSTEAWPRWVAGGAALLVPVAAAWILLPRIDEVPEGFPAGLLWDFRLASLGTQAVFWLGVGALFAFAARRRSPA